MRNSLIGDKAFYRQMLIIALPIMLQNLVTNFVSVLDNVMVGQLSTAQIGAVTIINNNLLFILNVCLFGGAAGAGIFTTQFYGSQDQEGIRYTMRFKVLVCLALTAVGYAICLLWSEPLIGLYLQGEGDPALRAETLHYGKQYLFIMLIGMVPFALTNAYASTLRECGYPMVPMLAGLAAMAINLVGNYILIFGHFGAPQMGVAGAAVATVASRYVEMIIVVGWTHLNPKKNPYIKGLYRSLRIPVSLSKKIVIKGMPILMNEAAYTVGMAFLNQCYSTCGLDVVPALSISTTIYNLMAVVFRSLSNGVGILVGRMMGAGSEKEHVYHENKKQLALCVATGIVFGALTIALSGAFPLLFNTADSVRQLATGLIIISAIAMPLQAYIFAAYFTLRAGGKTVVTFLFDSGAIWVLMIPIAFVCSRFTAMHILVIYALCNAMDFVKCLIGYWFLKKRDWIQNLAVK
jgi:putative MATE family efflux protein